MHKDQPLEVFKTLMVNHVTMNADNIFKVWRRLDQGCDIEIRRDRLESRAGSCRRHVEGRVGKLPWKVSSVRTRRATVLIGEGVCRIVAAVSKESCKALKPTPLYQIR
jgi:hypothetical protein